MEGWGEVGREQSGGVGRGGEGAEWRWGVAEW